MPKKPVRIEIDTAKAKRVLFLPINAKLRSRIDSSKIDDDHRAGELRSIYPGGTLPGLIVELDVENGIGAIVEPMHLDPVLKKWGEDHAKQLGQQMPAPRVEFKRIRVAEWAYWMRRLLDSGKAKLLEGELPEIDPGRESITVGADTFRPEPLRRKMVAVQAHQSQPAAAV